MTVLAPPLDRISKVARPYPAYRLEACDTGLILFSAAFLGHNDAIHFARNDIATTCVDIDGGKLEEMHDLYPGSWHFRETDAWEFAENTRDTWDAVSVDTWTGDLMERSLASLDLWCSLANKLVTVTITRGHDYTAPEGWKSSLFERSTDVRWLVLTR